MSQVGAQAGLLPQPARPAAAGRHARAPGRLVGDVAGQLRRLRPDAPSRYALGMLTPTQAVAPDWMPAGAALPEMLHRAGDRLDRSPAVHASSLAGALAYAVLGRPGVALAVLRRVPDPAAVWVRLAADGLVSETAVARRAVAVLPSDPLGSHPDAVVAPDAGSLTVWLAARAFAVLDPVLADLHDRTRFGLVPMWNLAADNLLGPCTVAALLAGQDQTAARVRATGIVDALVSLGAPVRRRGSTQPVRLGRCPAAVQAPVRGSCCLHYRSGSSPDSSPDSSPGADSERHRADPGSDALCASCPLLDPGRRAHRFDADLPATGPFPVPTPWGIPLPVIRD